MNKNAKIDEMIRFLGLERREFLTLQSAAVLREAMVSEGVYDLELAARAVVRHLLSRAGRRDEADPVFSSLQRCAAVTGIPVSALRSAKAAGAPGFDNSSVRLFGFLKWYFAQQMESRGLLDVNQERARLLREQADRVALKNKMMRREMLDRDAVARSIAQMSRVFTERMRTLESLSSQMNPGDAARARAILAEWSDQTMRVLRHAGGAPHESDNAEGGE